MSNKIILGLKYKGRSCLFSLINLVSLHFEALIRRGTRNGIKGKCKVYGLSSLSKLDDLLGERYGV